MPKNDRSESSHRTWGNSQKGSSKSHRERCQNFAVTISNKRRRLQREVRKHPANLQAAARLKELR